MTIFPVTTEEFEEQTIRAREGMAMIVTGPHRGTWLHASHREFVMPVIKPPDYSSFDDNSPPALEPPKLEKYTLELRQDQRAYVYVWVE